MRVQWNFGYGLSYTEFEYSNLRIDKAEFRAGDTLHFSVDVSNKGERAGKESVLLYSSDLVASISPEVRRLREFTKVELQPGETRCVEFDIPASRLGFVGVDEEWVLEEGDFLFSVGGQTVSARCTETSLLPKNRR